MSQPSPTVVEASPTAFESAPLPDGWRWVRLGDVCSTTSGGTPSRGFKTYYGGGIAWVKSGELTDGEIRSTEETITEEGLANSSAKLFPVGTLLIALYGATVGKLGILEIDAATNQAVCAIFTGDSVHRDYLFFYLLRERESLLQISFGGAQPNISQDIVRSIKVALPPFPEQKRVAAILKEQMAAVERARAAAEAQLKAAKDLPAAYLRVVFDGQEGTKWQTKKLGDLLLNIQAGKSISCEERPATLQEWGVLKVSAISWGDFQPEENKVLPEGFIAPLEYEVQSGDLLISRANTTELVGATVLVRNTRPKLMLSDKTLRLTPKEDLVLKEYLQVALRTHAAREFIEGNATGTSSSMKNISQEVIKNVPIVLPSIDEQRGIVDNLDRQTFSVGDIKKALKLRLESINKLPAALLRQAFTGKL